MTSSVLYEGNLRTVCTHLKSTTVIETDAPVDNQGKGERFSPSDLVATALGSCMLTIMGIKARDLNINLEGVQIDVEKIMATEPRRISGINLTFRFPKSLVITEKEKIILEKAAHTCPVIHSIHPDIKVNAAFNWTKENVIQ
jgi:putative redox protein